MGVGTRCALHSYLYLCLYRQNASTLRHYEKLVTEEFQGRFVETCLWIRPLLYEPGFNIWMTESKHFGNVARVRKTLPRYYRVFRPDNPNTETIK